MQIRSTIVAIGVLAALASTAPAQGQLLPPGLHIQVNDPGWVVISSVSTPNIDCTATQNATATGDTQDNFTHSTTSAQVDDATGSARCYVNEVNFAEYLWNGPGFGKAQHLNEVGVHVEIDLATGNGRASAEAYALAEFTTNLLGAPIKAEAFVTKTILANSAFSDNDSDYSRQGWFSHLVPPGDTVWFRNFTVANTKVSASGTWATAFARSIAHMSTLVILS